MSEPNLVMERKDQANATPVIGPIMLTLTPPIDESYWAYRVKVSERQAILAFPKFGTIGIGFAAEDDWNTNLPYTIAADEIFKHISHNKGDDSIPDQDCITAIEMIPGGHQGRRGGGVVTTIDLAPAPMTPEFVAAANPSWSTAFQANAWQLEAIVARMTRQQREDLILAADMLRAAALAVTS